MNSISSPTPSTSSGWQADDHAFTPPRPPRGSDAQPDAAADDIHRAIPVGVHVAVHRGIHVDVGVRLGARVVTKLIQQPVVLASELVRQALAHFSTPPEHADMVAANLIGADHRGIHSHGLARMPMYVDGLIGGTIDPIAVPIVERDSPAASCWNGRRAFGQVNMTQIVDRACRGAAEVGAHVAVVHTSNHFGYAGHWVRQAAARGMVAMTFTSGGPLVVPAGGVKRELGTNPLAFGLSSSCDELMIDMSTSTVAMGKLEIAERHGQPIPSGWAIDGDGAPIEDPSDLIDDLITSERGGLLPLGGVDIEQGAHKGYALGLMVEAMSTILSGGRDLRVDRAGADRYTGHVSHSLIAIDPGHLAGEPITSDALDRMTNALRSSPPRDPLVPVKVPGDPERSAVDQCGEGHFLVEHDAWNLLVDLARPDRSRPTQSLGPEPKGAPK